jgi:hypothetical protein
MLPSPPSSTYYNSPLSVTGTAWGYPIPSARLSHMNALLQHCLPVGPSIQLDHELDDEDTLHQIIFITPNWEITRIFTDDLPAILVEMKYSRLGTVFSLKHKL